MIHYITADGVENATVVNELRVVKRTGIPVVLHSLASTSVAYMKPETLNELEQRYTQQQRDANQILEKQTASSSERDTFNLLCGMKQLAAQMPEEIAGNPDLDQFAKLLNEGWEMKRSLGHGISNAMIDEWYQAALDAGAQGEKLLGAGGGGFLMLMASLYKHDLIRETLGHLRELPFKIDRRGRRIIFISDRYGF